MNLNFRQRTGGAVPGGTCLAASFEADVAAAVRGERSKAIKALSRKRPKAYEAWAKDMAGIDAKGADIFDTACAKLQDTGLPRTQAIRECVRALPLAHAAWIKRANDRKSSF